MTTLYVTDQGALLRVDRQQFQILHQNCVRYQVPANRVSHILLFGCCNVSHAATSLSLRKKIPIIYLSQQGRYFGRLATAGQAEVAYLTQQVQRSVDPEFSLRLAINFVFGKVRNARVLLQRLCRRHPHADAEKAIESLALALEQVRLAKTIDSLRGYEGHSAHLYFQGLSSLFLHEHFSFEKRTMRPPQDPINSLLSLGYTLLHHIIYSNVQTLGLHPNFGHLHVTQRDRPALAMDLIEEFRAQIVDSLVVYLINSKIFTPEDFTSPDARGGVYLYPEGLKRFLKHWEEKLQTEVTHPHTGHKVSYRRCLELQAWEYIMCLTGERPDYRPMLWEK